MASVVCDYCGFPITKEGEDTVYASDEIERLKAKVERLEADIVNWKIAATEWMEIAEKLQDTGE